MKKQKKKLSAGAAIAIVLVIVVTTILVIILWPDSSGGSPAASPSAPAAAPASAPAQTEAATPAPAPLAENDLVSVRFEKLYEESYIQGAAYLTLAVTNLSDTGIWVYLDKASVNAEQLPTVMSGVPMYIMPGKTSRNPFILSYSALSIESVTEITALEFDIVIEDRETMKELGRISGVKVTP